MIDSMDDELNALREQLKSGAETVALPSVNLKTSVEHQRDQSSGDEIDEVQVKELDADLGAIDE